MKRWNKQKRYRDSKWTKVHGIHYTHLRNALQWCHRRDGKKFLDQGLDFFFEDAEDATAFYLTWINKPK